MPKRTIGIAINLYSHASYTTDEEINLLFEIINQSGSTIYVLKRNTPLEGVKGDCLSITGPGKSLLYSGSTVQRDPPKPRDFIRLLPGASKTAKIEISKAYPITKKGNYMVSLKKRKWEVLLKKPTLTSIQMSSKAQSPGKRSIAAKNARKSVTLPSIKFTTKEARFSVSQEPFSRQTVRQPSKARKGRIVAGTKKTAPVTSKLAKAAPVAAIRELTAKFSGMPQPCIVSGGTAEQQNTMQTAHKNGHALAAQALSNLNDDAHYQLWFGASDPGRLADVRSSFQSIVNDFENKTFTYNIDDTACPPGSIACTTAKNTIINICSPFWGLSAEGSSSMAGRVLHEHSHASASTVDVENGQDDCKQLAIDHPDDAVVNADSYEFFAEG
jgi:hypothetical protein